MPRNNDKITPPESAKSLRALPSDDANAPRPAKNMKSFLAKFKPSRKLIEQLDADARGVSRGKMPDITLGGAISHSEHLKHAADESKKIDPPEPSR